MSRVEGILPKKSYIQTQFFLIQRKNPSYTNSVKQDFHTAVAGITIWKCNSLLTSSKLNFHRASLCPDLLALVTQILNIIMQQISCGKQAKLSKTIQGKAVYN